MLLLLLLLVGQIMLVQSLEELPESQIEHGVWSDAQIHRHKALVEPMDTLRAIDLHEAIENVPIQQTAAISGDGLIGHTCCGHIAR
uniref:Putative secreted protein n=1 Tax=Anopheles darlingi TaxID=43151 RepID=A0A2M4DCN8_ANODA